MHMESWTLILGDTNPPLGLSEDKTSGNVGQNSFTISGENAPVRSREMLVSCVCASGDRGVSYWTKPHGVEDRGLRESHNLVSPGSPAVL
jgi:hypothetical protein